MESAASLSFSPDGRRLLAAYGQTNAALWDLESGERIKDLGFMANGASFLADGKHVLVNSVFVRGVAVYNAETGVKARGFDGADANSSLALSGDEKRLALSGTIFTGAQDPIGQLSVWDAESTEQLKAKQVTVDLDNGVGADGQRLGSSAYPDFGPIAFSPDGRRIYLAGRARLRAFDAVTLAELPLPDVPHFGSDPAVMDGDALISLTTGVSASDGGRHEIGLWRTGYGSAPEPARAARPSKGPRRAVSRRQTTR